MQLQTVGRDDVMIVVRDLDDGFRDLIPPEMIAQTRRGSGRQLRVRDGQGVRRGARLAPRTIARVAARPNTSGDYGFTYAVLTVV
jgi:hypothetical protein